MTASEFVSVVIPMHHLRLGHHLHDCLQSLDVCRRRGADFEVIVVVDGVGSPSALPVPDALGGSPIILGQKQAGPAAARNRGWRHATGTTVAFIDDDVMVDPGWAHDLVAFFASHPEVAGLGGRVRPMHPKNLVSRMMADFGHLDHRRTPDGLRLITANAAFRRAALEAVGGFDERFPHAAGEDWDLCRRLLAAGYELATTSTMGVRHLHPTTITAMRATARRYRRGRSSDGSKAKASTTPAADQPWRADLRTKGRAFRSATIKSLRRTASSRVQPFSAKSITVTLDTIELIAFGASYLRRLPAYVDMARHSPSAPGLVTAVGMSILEAIWHTEFSRPLPVDDSPVVSCQPDTTPVNLAPAERRFISVIVPTQGHTSLRKALESVADQTYTNWECIVVDDSGNPGVVSSLVPDDPRFSIVVKDGPHSPAAARNAGVGAAVGEIVVFLDDDDLLSLSRLERVANELGSHGMHLCATEVTWPNGTTSTGPLLLGDCRSDILRSSSPFVTQIAFHRWAFQPFDTSLRFGEDVEWWFRMREHAVFVTSPEVGYMKIQRDFHTASELDVRYLNRRRILQLHHDVLAKDHRARAFHRRRAAAAAYLSNRRGRAFVDAVRSWVDHPSTLAAKVAVRSLDPRPVSPGAEPATPEIDDPMKERETTEQPLGAPSPLATAAPPPPAYPQVYDRHQTHRN